MARSDNIVSTTFNFSIFFNSNVDARTGVYHFAVNVGALRGAGRQNLNLVLGYDHMSSNNMGFGVGWFLNLARYDAVNRRLTLSDGSSFRFISPLLANGDVTDKCQYLKPKNIKIIYNNEKLSVTHKDGTQEHFDANGNLVSLISPSGHTLTFAYILSHRLVSISDHAGKIFTIDYRSGGALFADKHGKNRVETQTSSIEKINQIRLPDGSKIGIGYRNISGLQLIEYIYHPTGATEKLTYNPQGIRLPDGGPVSSLPAVSSHEIYGPDITRISRSYSYSTNNFLGFGLSRYTEDVENLFETTANYTYSCTETIGNKKITKIFNKYHLLIEESLTDTSVSPNFIAEKRILDYYADTNKNFYAQPEQYQSQTKESVTYFNAAGQSRSLVVELEHDAYGNEITLIDAYGIKTQTLYYSAAGEGSAAPATPIGIPFLVKKQTITPSIRYSAGNEVGQEQTLYYTSLPRLGSGSYSVLSKEEVKTLNGKLLSSVQYSYVNDQQPYTHGLRSQRIITEGNTAHTETYNHQISEDNLITLETSKSKDLKDVEIKTIRNLHNSTELEVVDMMGVVTQKKYDAMFRVIQHTLRARTDYEIIRDYIYTIGNNSQLEIISSDGMQEKILYDTLGREKAHYITDSTGKLSKTQEKTYNALGQVSTITMFDDFGNGEVASTSSFEYNLWGELHKTQSSDGLAEIVEHDRVQNSKTKYLSTDKISTAKTTTYYNERGDVIKTQYPEFSTSQKFNGMGHKFEVVNPWGITTRYTLDDLGRSQLETRNSPHLLTVEKSFDDESHGEQLTEIKINGKVVGRRQYDSLHRVINESKGTYTTRYSYDTHSHHPTKVISPDGSSIEYALNLILDEVTEYRASDGDTGSYTFDKPNGRLVEAKNSQFTLSKTYYINGLLKSESQSGRTANYTFSRRGKPLSSSDYFFYDETHRYDKHHRLISVTGRNSTVTLSYDELSRVKTENIVAANKSSSVEHQYVYDLQNRLIQKITLVDGVHYLSQKYSYYKDNNLSQKILTDEAYNVSTETYTYDDLGRLKEFTANGYLSPSYLDKGPIKRQSFTLDSLNNVIETKTTFMQQGVEQNDTATYRYDTNNLLLSITHSHPAIPAVNLTYDANGNLAQDERGQRYQYNVLGHLQSIHDANQQLISRYQYSANGTQLLQSVPGQGDIQLFYNAKGLINETQERSNTRLLSVNGRTLSRTVMHPGSVYVTHLVGDHKNSTLAEINQSTKRRIIYTPYGEATYK